LGKADMKPSVWTRDLFDNRFGRVFLGYVLPFVVIASGTAAVIVRKVTFRRFDYVGFDAVLVGLGILCLGVMGAITQNPRLLQLPAILRRRIFVASGAILIVCFSTALIRNV